MAHIGSRMERDHSMKLGTVAVGARRAVAVVDPNKGSFRWVEDLIGRPLRDMLELIENYDEIRPQLHLNGAAHDLASAQIFAPFRPPRNVLCVGKNYLDHAHEFAKSGV